MPVEWTISVSAILIGVSQLSLVFGAYYGLKTKIDLLAAKITVAMLEEQALRARDLMALRSDMTLLITNVDMSIKQLAVRVSVVEAGHAEWSSELRKRTHDLAERLGGIVLKIDRLERA